MHCTFGSARLEWRQRNQVASRSKKDTEAVSDTCTENHNPSPHLVDDPSKVRNPPVPDVVAEDAEEELNPQLTVRLLHRVVVSETSKLADLFSLFTGK